MNLWKRFFITETLYLYTDGASTPAATGLAAVVRDESGSIVQWFSQRTGPMSNNEAEYAAVILALEALGRRPQARLTRLKVFSDSQIVVEQMRGGARVRSPRLMSVHAHLRLLVTCFEQVEFHHIPRQQNRLADALAGEALRGPNEGQI